MAKLTKKGLESARFFIETNGRAVDQKLLSFEFEAGSATDVIDALGTYQNEDGGFGKALEADIRMETSSVLATTVAFQCLGKVDAPGRHPCVRAGVRYLLNTYDAGSQVWPIVPPEVDNAPRAPWWNFEGTEKGFGGFRLNPTAEVLRYLLDYPDEVPVDLLTGLTDTVISRIQDSPEEMEMHELMCCIRLAESESLPEATRALLLPKIEQTADRVVERDPRNWSGYGVKPLALAEGPTALLAPRLDEDIQRNLDYEIRSQGDDGSWGPNWSWSGDAWQRAERDWKSHITVNMLRTLRAFDRIE